MLSPPKNKSELNRGLLIDFDYALSVGRNSSLCADGDRDANIQDKKILLHRMVGVLIHKINHF
jgi:hypothetical protein